MLRYLIFLTCLLGSGYGTTSPPQGDLTTADIRANFSALWTELRQLRQEIQTHVYGGHILTPRNGYYPSGVHSHEDHDHQDGDAHHHHHGLHSKENHNETDGSDHSEHDHHDSDTHSHDHYDDHHHHDHHHSEHPQGYLSGYPQPHVHDFIYPIHQHRSIHSHNHKEGENDTEKHVGHHHYGHYHGMPYGYGESHYHPEGDHGHTHGGEDHHHRDIHLDGHDHDHEGDTSSESGEVNHASSSDHHHEHQDEHQDHGHDHTHEHDHGNHDHTHEHDHDNHDHTQGHDHDHHDHDHGDSHHNHDHHDHDHDHHDHGYHMGLWPRPMPHHGYHGRPHVLLNPNYYMGYPILARKTPKAFCHLLPNAEIDSKVKGHVSINPQTDGENGTIFEVDITGIVISEDNPHKKHGFHIHENKIVDQKCSSAGGHYNPTNQDHGAPDAEIRHVGDLGNIDVDENGKVFHKIIKDDIAEIYGPDTIIGKSIVIHELEDDLGLGGNEESLKTGNAGRRLACCTIQSIQAARRTQIRFN